MPLVYSVGRASVPAFCKPTVYSSAQRSVEESPSNDHADGCSVTGLLTRFLLQTGITPVAGMSHQAAEMVLLIVGRGWKQLEVPGLLGVVRGSEPQSEPVERLGVVEFLGRGDGPPKPLVEIDTCDLAGSCTKLSGRESALSSVSLVGEAHHIIERLLASRRFS